MCCQALSLQIATDKLLKPWQLWYKIKYEKAPIYYP